MKKSIFILFAIVLAAFRLPAQTRSCCSASAAGEFAMLGNDGSFQAAHLSPLPFHFVAEKGELVTFKVAEGNDGRAFFIRAAGNSDKYLFVFHEWWGLNDYIKQQAEMFSKDFPDVNIMAIDLYDGQLTSTADEAAKMMQSVKADRAEAIIKGAINYIGTTAKVQTIGWCFGGTWSLQAAIMLGKQAKGCVMYYGMPEKDPAKLANLKAPVQGIFALQDGWITKEIVESFEKQMREMKKPISISWFDADHAFANPSNPKHDEAATAKARAITVGFLKGNFSK